LNVTGFSRENSSSFIPRDSIFLLLSFAMALLKNRFMAPNVIEKVFNNKSSAQAIHCNSPTALLVSYHYRKHCPPILFFRFLFRITSDFCGRRAEFRYSFRPFLIANLVPIRKNFGKSFRNFCKCLFTRKARCIPPLRPPSPFILLFSLRRLSNFRQFPRHALMTHPEDEHTFGSSEDACGSGAFAG